MIDVPIFLEYRQQPKVEIVNRQQQGKNYIIQLFYYILKLNSISFVTLIYGIYYPFLRLQGNHL